MVSDSAIREALSTARADSAGSSTTAPAPAAPPPFLVVIPTFNEAGNIEALAAEVLRVPGAELLIVDDASPDGTGEIADRLAAEDGRVHVLHRQNARGQGSAYVVGFRYAVAREFTYVVQMDCDFSHDPRDIPRLIEPLESGSADVSVGSRYVDGGRIVGWGADRMLLSRAGNLYAKLLLGFRVRDWTAGFKAYRTEALASLMGRDDYAEGYAFHVEMSYRVLAAGLRLRELPITFVDRVEGESKMGHTIIREAVAKVFKIRFAKGER